MKKHQYSLFTMIAMVIGIVIGSGIYFRADDILHYTNGNLALGLLVILLGALCIIFGSLTLVQLTDRTKETSGMISYYKHYIGESVACGFGWFQLFVYFPTINAVVAYACSIFTYIFLGIEVSFEQHILTAIAYISFFLLINTLNKKLGAFTQTISTITKLVPLLIIAVLGLLHFNAQTFIASVKQISSHDFSWMTALVPMAFSYDGWMIVLNIAQEVDNPEKNIPRALTIGPLIIVFVYALFFIGLNMLLSPEQILIYGNDSIFQASLLIHPGFASAIMGFVLISILGALNGLILGAIRLPQLLAQKSYLPNIFNLKAQQSDRNVSKSSAYFYFVLVMFWMFIHYLFTKADILQGRDISEISIVFSYVAYIPLYIIAFRLTQKRKNRLLKKIIPILASIGSIIILIGSLLTSWFYVTLFLLFSALIMLLGIIYQNYISK